ncbi:MAG TPA: sigma-E factor regulatory protein RseB domain-containing protein [Micromonosporaceae bacterium]
MAVMATSRPLLRWALPAVVTVAVVGGGAATAAIRASADASLPPRSAAQLLVDVQTANTTGLSGTVVERADLGLPNLPSTGGNGGSGFNSLITGSHTLRVWYAGPDKARVALLDTLGESDLIRNGTEVWAWSSRDNTATHRTVQRDEHAAPDATGTPLTPQQAADRALAALDPTTTVSTGTSARVAGRAAYELVLAPRDTSSLLNQVRIAIDGQRHVPLRVQVYAKDSASPVGEIGFTQVSFARPDDAQFRFTPPPGAKVTEGGGGTPDRTGRPAAQPVMIGTGWTTVAVTHLPADALPGPDATGSPRGEQNPLGQVLGSLPRVGGAWGSGRLLTSKAFSALLTDDGRMLIGAVTPDRLYAAAADPRAK